ncbi:hypothetical protein U0070_020683 [Myodes glareolus]|uniref:FERM domain-containing protein n=1 Tax=Myodes glareolus TaxID=447135 RepID=A0AAW0K3R4_MYOGA
MVPLSKIDRVHKSIAIFSRVAKKHAKGQDLFDQIVYHLDLVETDYFGLQFLDSAQVTVRLAGIHFENNWLLMLTAVPQALHTDRGKSETEVVCRR